MKPFILLIGMLTLFTAVNSQPAARFIDSVANEKKFSGNILVQKNGLINYQKSFGLANIPFSIPNTLDTKFKIASITKLFTAVMVMQLHEEGKLDIDKPIRTYLSDYNDEATEKITVYQLLTHLSGLANLDTVTTMESALKNGLPVYQKPRALDDLVQNVLSGTLVNKPGSNFDYNNADYILLGKIIETVSGKEYEQILKDKILEPLKLKNTGMLRQQKIFSKLADTYFFRDDINQLVPDLPVYAENWHAAGAMYSTTSDLAIFTQALFDKKLISSSSLEKMFISGPGEYGFGVWVYKDYDIHGKMYTIIKRPGQIMGAQGMIFHIVEENTSLLILSNTGNISLDELAAEIAEKIVR